MSIFKFFLVTLLTFSKLALAGTPEQCSSENIDLLISQVERELNYTDVQSLPFEAYKVIDLAMSCDFQGNLGEEDKKRMLSVLRLVKSKKTTPFVWADSKGADIWENEVSKRGFRPEEIRNDLPITLSQLNSSVIAFVPSESGDRTTNYNFESDLNIDLFSPWDRRYCNCMSNEEIQMTGEDLAMDRISEKEVANFTRNYSVIEVSKIAVHQSPTCYWYEESDEVRCEHEFNSSIVHEILHLLETRYPKFIEALHNARGGYKDKLRAAQKVVPEFGVTKCTHDSWEEFCSEGPINKEETKKIVKAATPPQDTGSIAGRYYAKKLDPKSEFKFCTDEIITRGNAEFCVDKSRESLYTFVRGGEEYIAVLLEKALVDRTQFAKVASEEEKRLFTLLMEYIF